MLAAVELSLEYRIRGPKQVTLVKTPQTSRILAC